MSASQDLQRILDAVFDLTGRQVVPQEDPTLSTLAKTHSARGAAPAHVVLYHPKARPFADYQVAFQCGFLIRTFTLPEIERFDVASSAKGRRNLGVLINEVMKESARQLPKVARDKFRDLMVNGLLTQLRSVPVGLRIDDWIRKEYSALCDQQRISIELQLQENLGPLQTGIKNMTPEVVYRSNVGINAAFAAYWSRTWDEKQLISPYRAAGYLGLGESLLAIFDELPPDAAHDRLLIEGWADRLGLRSYVEFVPGPAISTI